MYTKTCCVSPRVIIAVYRSAPKKFDIAVVRLHAYIIVYTVVVGYCCSSAETLYTARAQFAYLFVFFLNYLLRKYIKDYNVFAERACIVLFFTNSIISREWRRGEAA